MCFSVDLILCCLCSSSICSTVSRALRRSTSIMTSRRFSSSDISAWISFFSWIWASQMAWHWAPRICWRHPTENRGSDVHVRLPVTDSLLDYSNMFMLYLVELFDLLLLLHPQDGGLLHQSLRPLLSLQFKLSECRVHFTWHVCLKDLTLPLLSSFLNEGYFYVFNVLGFIVLFFICRLKEHFYWNGHVSYFFFLPLPLISLHPLLLAENLGRGHDPLKLSWWENNGLSWRILQRDPKKWQVVLLNLWSLSRFCSVAMTFMLFMVTHFQTCSILFWN